MTDITLPLGLVERSLQHIENCAEVWDCSGVSRSRAITRTVQEIRTALAAAPQPSASYMESDAVDALTEDGWTWDGDQWQRPATPQPSEEPVAWIICEERMPDDEQEVLVLVWPTVYIAEREKGEWWHLDAGGTLANVTHWMPLPKFPPADGGGR